MPTPLPPSDFHGKNVPATPSKSKTLYRISESRHPSPIYYGRASRGRFDFVSAPYGVCYLGASPTACLLEVFGSRILKGDTFTRSELSSYRIYKVKVPDLDLFPLVGNKIYLFGANGEVTSGTDYPASRIWSQAIMTHPFKYHGIRYIGRACQDESVALFGDGATSFPHEGSIRSDNGTALSKSSECLYAIACAGCAIDPFS